MTHAPCPRCGATPLFDYGTGELCDPCRQLDLDAIARCYCTGCDCIDDLDNVLRGLHPDCVGGVHIPLWGGISEDEMHERLRSRS
jgi:hypothetical protein